METAALNFRCLIDYASFTFLPKNALRVRVDRALTFFERRFGIPRDSWKEGRRGVNGYGHSLRFENITIYYDGAHEQGVNVDISGQGCRYLDVLYKQNNLNGLCSKYTPSVSNEKFALAIDDRANWLFNDWRHLMYYIHCRQDIHFTRIDVAIDDFNGLLDVPHMFYQSLQGNIRMKFRNWSPDGRFNSDGQANGISLYYGSEQSRLRVVFYEKAKQLNLDMDWTRCEIRLKHERANEFAAKYVDGLTDIGVIAAGYLKNQLTFLDPESKDKNKSRRKSAPFWDDFLSTVPSLRLASALPDRSITKSRRWADRQWTKTFAMMTLAYYQLDDNWLNDLLTQGILKLDDADFDIIKAYREVHQAKPLQLEHFNNLIEQKKYDDRAGSSQAFDNVD